MAGALDEIPPAHYYIYRQPDKTRWMPSPSGNPAERYFSLGSWDFDRKVSRLEVLAIDTSQEAVEFSAVPTGQQNAPKLRVIQSWELQGRVSELQVVPREGNSLMLVTGSRSGHLSVATTDLTQGPSSGKGPLVELPKLHKGAVTGFDVGRDSLDLVSVGVDGKINIISLLHGAKEPLTTWDMHGAVSYSAVQWTSAQELVTAGTGGLLQCWDRRSPGRAVSQAPLEWAHRDGGGAMHCIDVHQSRRHICAVGCSGGSVVAWDLRWQQKPLVLVGPTGKKSRNRSSPSPLNAMSMDMDNGGEDLIIGKGDVWEVRFDKLAQGGVRAGAFDTDRNKLPPVMMCTEDGVLAVAGGGEALELLVESCAINTFDIDPEFGQDVICGTEQECLVYFRRPRYGVGAY